MINFKEKQFFLIAKQKIKKEQKKKEKYIIQHRQDNTK